MLSQRERVKSLMLYYRLPPEFAAVIDKALLDFAEEFRGLSNEALKEQLRRNTAEKLARFTNPST